MTQDVGGKEHEPEVMRRLLRLWILDHVGEEDKERDEGLVSEGPKVAHLGQHGVPHLERQ